MRKRIIQLARGKFETEKPEVVFSENPVSFQVIEGKSFTGEFRMKCTNHMSLRGMIYATDSRMTCLTPQYEGENVRIRYQYYAKGLEEGKKISGTFVVICNQLTLNLPYEGVVTKMYYESSCGTIRNLDDFTSLAKEHWQEAVKFFYHPAFAGIIGRSRKREQMLYKGLMTSSDRNQGMEEFLIADGRKNLVDFSLEETETSYYNISQQVKKGIIIHKEGWGYLSINVVSAAPFIRIIKKNIDTSDFQGPSCRYEFMIDSRKMRDGRNHGYIIFSSPYKKITISVTASTQSELDGVNDAIRLRQKKLQAQFMHLMVGKMTELIPKDQWVSESLKCLDLLKRGDRNPMYDVARAYLFASNNQFQEADRLLKMFEEDYEEDEQRISNEWVLDYYIRYHIEKNSAQKKRYKAVIEEIYKADMKDNLLFWLSYTLQDDYKNDEVRLQVLEKRIRSGSTSPVFLAEAWMLLKKNPDLLTKLGRFEVYLLHWAYCHGMIADEFRDSLFRLADEMRTFSPAVLKILEESYRRQPREEDIPVICRYLIKGNCWGSRYLFWYEQGISRELRITGLYEAYLQSLDEERVMELPRMLKMYFQFECNVPYQKTAVLYSNIIANKDKDPDLYTNYQKNMGHFAIEQAEAGHISENLAVIYEHFLNPTLVDDKLAHTMSKVLYTCRIRIKRPDILYAYVYQWQLKDPQMVPIMGQSAVFQLYTKDFVIVFEDKSGRRYVDTVECELIRMMNPEPYLEPCLAFAPDAIEYIIDCFSRLKETRNIKVRSTISFETFLLSDTISPLFKADLTAEIMKNYPNVQESSLMQKYLMTADLSRLLPQSRSYLLDMMMDSNMADLVYERIREFGCDQLPSYQRGKLFAYIIRRYKGESEDMLIAFCAQTFLQGISNEELVRYLCNYYTGPADVMFDIWEHSSRYKIRAFELEERILITSLYGDYQPEKYAAVFRHYVESNGRELIMQAYMSSCAQEYFMKNTVLEPFMFELYQKRYVSHRDQSDAVKLALLKYLSTLGNVEGTQKAIEDELLAEFTGRNMTFAFYRNLDEELILKYHLDDKIFLEYRSRPQNHVMIHISRDEDGQEFRAEEMHEVYYGIYVKSFVLFFGELVRYYITEETENKIELMESNRLMPETSGDKKNGRYHMINQMLMSRILWEDDRLLKEMQKYKEAESAAGTLFGIE